MINSLFLAVNSLIEITYPAQVPANVLYFSISPTTIDGLVTILAGIFVFAFYTGLAVLIANSLRVQARLVIIILVCCAAIAWFMQPEMMKVTFVMTSICIGGVAALLGGVAAGKSLTRGHAVGLVLAMFSGISMLLGLFLPPFTLEVQLLVTVLVIALQGIVMHEDLVGFFGHLPGLYEAAYGGVSLWFLICGSLLLVPAFVTGWSIVQLLIISIGFLLGISGNQA